MSNTEWLDDPTDSLDDREFPDEDDLDDSDVETVTCPECGAEVYAETQRCPHCGNYIVAVSHGFTASVRWWFALGVLGALVAIGYDGPVSAEPFNKALNALDDEPAVEKTADAMKTAFAMI